MKLIVEFPLKILESYNGRDYLDEILDDNISYLLGEYCFENKIEFKIISLDLMKAVTELSDELVRYILEIKITIRTL